LKTLAFVATAYIPKYDGISVYTENILRELLLSEKVQNQELFVDIYIGENVLELLSERLKDSNIKQENVRFIPVTTSNFYKKILDLTMQLRKHTPYDLVFMTNFMPTVFLGLKTVKVLHDLSINHYPDLYPSYYKYYHDFLIRHAKTFDDAIGYISKTTLADMERFYNINEQNKKLLYVPNGIPFKVKRYTRPEVSEIEKKYDLQELDLLVVGRINKHKGFDRILEFCKYYDMASNQTKSFEKITLHFVGKQTSETEGMLQDLHLQNIQLVFHGFLDDEGLNTLYKKSHFCFFLSRNEGYGLPLIEALWFRCIPIISDIPIFNEIMGSSYPKFNDTTGYTKAIVNFIDDIFLSVSYRKNIADEIEKIVMKERNGYKLAATNLLAYIDKIGKK